MRIALAQINTVVGDIERNADRIFDAVMKATDAGAQLIVTPELALSGYPPEDLLMRPRFLKAIESQLSELTDRIDLEMYDRYKSVADGPIVLVGAPLLRPTGLVNSLVALGPERYEAGVANSEVRVNYRQIGRYDKQHLPNYAVFDERRYFRPGSQPGILHAFYERIGLTVCEDIWIPDGPANTLAAAGCGIIINASASPYHMGKPSERVNMLCQRARDTTSFIVYCNQVGGQDELIFDGCSVVIGPDGNVIARGALAAEDLIVVDVDPQQAQHARLRDIRVRELSERTQPNEEALTGIHEMGTDGLSFMVSDPTRRAEVAKSLPALVTEPWPEGPEQMYKLLCLALADYTRKTGFSKVLIGVSGGIDSAVVAQIAADALGPENVIGITMPSRFNSEGTLSDAHVLMNDLGIEAHEIAIQPMIDAYQTAGIATQGLSAENIQARIRGNILMSQSNDLGALVLACGNKSEYAVGYATLYGDTCGGFAPLRDVSKLRVFELARWVNDHAGGSIPESIIHRPPSAELAEGQLDSNSLPEYEVLDPQLRQIVELDQDGVNEQVEKLVWRAEYKRRQAPPGPKVTAKAFGRDRRMPIANGWANSHWRTNS